jgi:hypothetical protein
VTDCSKHPLSGQALRLERKQSGAWKGVATGRTRADGSYSLAARGPGVYRVVAGARASNSVTVR